MKKYAGKFSPKMSDRLFDERLEKAEKIRNLGIDPFPVLQFCTSHSASDAKKLSPKPLEEVQNSDTKSVAIAGRIVLFRAMGKLAFGQLSDESGKIQVCFQKDFFEVENLVSNTDFSPMKFLEKLVDLGDFLGVRGEMFETKHGEITLFVRELVFLSKALRPLPEKFHGLEDRETCYRERNLDLATNKETRERFLQRSMAVREIRDFFAEKNFVEVETPILQLQAGGAMAKVFETHHNALDHDFVLRIALELNLKRALGGGLERVFEIGKCFRNEGSDPSHLQEFTMCECYAAYENIETNQKLMEEMLRRICTKVFGKTTFTVLDKDEKPVEIDFAEPFASVKFADLLRQYAGIEMNEISDEDLRKYAIKLGIEDAEKTGRGNLLDDIYKKTARPHLIKPTFVLDWPSDLKPLAAPNGDGTSNVYQLLIASWEVINAYGELIDPVTQRQFFEAQAEAKSAGDETAMEVDEVFLKAMEHGFPPMTGIGFGVDRILALLTGQPNLRDMVLFPTMKPIVNSNANTEKKEVANAKSNCSKMNSERGNGEKETPKIDDSTKKFVAVLNKKIDPGKLMNALGHMAAGISSKNSEEKYFLEYRDANNGIHPNISHFPFIILRADNGNQIRNVRKLALKNDIEFTDFADTMTVGTSAEQVERTKKTSEEDMEYFGICLFGDAEMIGSLTKKFSLWR